jgi:serine/threonine protein kinase
VIDLSRDCFDALAHDDEWVLYRARGKEDGSQVLVLVPAVQHPRPDVLKRLEHEYSLREELDREWAVRPLALNRREGQMMLVLEDPSSAAARLDRYLKPGGSALPNDVCGQPMELSRFFRLAINLAAGLEKLHRRGLVHKDIKPAHILVDFETSKVWFTGLESVRGYLANDKRLNLRK